MELERTGLDEFFLRARHDAHVRVILPVIEANRFLTPGWGRLRAFRPALRRNDEQVDCVIQSSTLCHTHPHLPAYTLPVAGRRPAHIGLCHLNVRGDWVITVDEQSLRRTIV